MMPWINDLKLEGETVILAPLQLSHKAGLLKAAADGKLWELWYTSVPSAATMDRYLTQALQQASEGQEVPFTVLSKVTGEIIGSTRYYNLQPEHRRLEIGYTWYAKQFQRTQVNTECKLLLLQYAFEELDCIAVQFMTHQANSRSRAAIARLGAKQDGILRNHRLNADGTTRDSVVFSITDQEWPDVKQELIRRIKK